MSSSAETHARYRGHSRRCVTAVSRRQASGVSAAVPTTASPAPAPGREGGCFCGAVRLTIETGRVEVMMGEQEGKKRSKKKGLLAVLLAAAGAIFVAKKRKQGAEESGWEEAKPDVP